MVISVPTVLSYVTFLPTVFSVHVIMVIFWMKMEEHVMVCFNIVKQHYRCYYVSYVTNDLSNIQLHGTYVNLRLHINILFRMSV